MIRQAGPIGFTEFQSWLRHRTWNSSLDCIQLGPGALNNSNEAYQWLFSCSESPHILTSTTLRTITNTRLVGLASDTRGRWSKHSIKWGCIVQRSPVIKIVNERKKRKRNLREVQLIELVERITRKVKEPGKCIKVLTATAMLWVHMPSSQSALDLRYKNSKVLEDQRVALQSQNPMLSWGHPDWQNFLCNHSVLEEVVAT